MGKSTFYYCHGKNLSIKPRGWLEDMPGTGVKGAMDGCGFSLANLRGQFLPLNVFLLGFIDGWRAGCPWER